MVRGPLGEESDLMQIAPLVDFPSSPTIGQLKVGPQGEVWMWDGVKWTAWFSGDGGGGGGGGATLVPVIISQTAPVGATDGKLWWDNSAPAGREYIRYQNAWVRVEALDGLTGGGGTGPQGPAGPPGPQGPQGIPGAVGPGINFIGSLPSTSQLPPTGNDVGDAYTISGNLWVWGEDLAWHNMGTVVGPAGPTGAQGPVGPAGPTGSPGSAGQQGATGPAGKGLLNFTSAEQNTGLTWIDGSAIYQKSFFWAANPGSVSLGITGLSQVMSIDSGYFYSSGSIQEWEMGYINSVTSAGMVNFSTITNGSNFYLTIRYTKS
jgi:hypothetical protein